jgi:nicotinamidase-related amidase
MRDLIESGFRVAVVKDATAAAILPGLNGYEAALVNFQMMQPSYFTEEIVTDIKNFKK